MVPNSKFANIQIKNVLMVFERDVFWNISADLFGVSCDDTSTEIMLSPMIHKCRQVLRQIPRNGFLKCSKRW